MGISGNGVRISGMIIIMVLFLMEFLGKMEVARPVLFRAAAGSAIPGTVDQRAAVGSVPSTATSTSVSAS